MQRASPVSLLFFAVIALGCGSESSGAPSGGGAGSTGGSATGGTAGGSGGVAAGGSGGATGGSAGSATGGSSPGFVANDGYSTTGTPAVGGSVTLDKSSGGFGEGPLVVLYDDFSNLAPGATLALDQPLIGSYSPFPNEELIVGSPQGRADSHGGLIVADGELRKARIQFDPATQVFFTETVRGREMKMIAAPSSWGEINYKLVWFHDGNVSGGSFDWYPYILGITPGSFATMGWASNSTGQGNLDNQVLAYQFDFADWNTWEFWMDVSGGNAEVTQTNPASGRNSFSHSNDWASGWSGTAQFSHADVEPYCSHDSLAGVTVDVDDMYLATGPNARARVLLADSSNLEEAKQIALCPTTAWSDTSITFTLPDSMGSLAGAHLFVVKGDGTALAVGQFQSAP